jgi:hypothetical protein
MINNLHKFRNPLTATSLRVIASHCQRTKTKIAAITAEARTMVTMATVLVTMVATAAAIMTGGNDGYNKDNSNGSDNGGSRGNGNCCCNSCIEGNRIGKCDGNSSEEDGCRDIGGGGKGNEGGNDCGEGNGVDDDGSNCRGNGDGNGCGVFGDYGGGCGIVNTATKLMETTITT